MSFEGYLGERWPGCCAPARCRCGCGCRAHSHYRRCRLCAAGQHDAARRFLAEPSAPTLDRLGHLLPERRPRAVEG